MSVFMQRSLLLLVLCVEALVPARLAARVPPNILVLGDSLSSGYGLRDDQGWVMLLQDRLRNNGHPHRVINSSISGDTTANVLSRLDTTLAEHQPAIVVVELGGNDGLRALPVSTIQQNLESILTTIRENGAKILLAGMRLPPNYGPAYVSAFERIYPVIAAKYEAILVPFFMDGVATHTDMMQDDGVHPNAAAQSRLLSNLWPHLESLLKQQAP
jgi:acyl-CoA thioesterase-1